jgi:hypothetical protein
MEDSGIVNVDGKVMVDGLLEVGRMWRPDTKLEEKS